MSGFEGKSTIELNGIDYEAIVNLRVITQFCESTGKDFFHVAISAMDAFAKTDREELLGLARASVLTQAVPMSDAVWLFYLAFKEANSQVQFDEIQEAVLMEGPMATDKKESYPIAFINLVTAAIIGPMDPASKKD